MRAPVLYADGPSRAVDQAAADAKTELVQRTRRGVLLMPCSFDLAIAPIENRASLRTAKSAVGVALSVHGARSILIQNMSDGGAQIAGRGFPPVGGRLLLRSEELEEFATVAWANFGVCGLRFEPAE